MPERDYEFVSNALSWVECNLQRFRPASLSRPEEIEMQRLAELSLAVWLHRRAGSHDIRVDLSRVAEFVRAMADDPRLWHRAVRYPGEFIPVCDLLSSSEATTDDRRTRALQAVIDTGALDGFERSKVSAMELAISAEGAGLRHTFPSLEQVATTIPPLPNPAYVGTAGCYALTHYAIFATRFGSDTRPPVGGLSDVSRLRRVYSSIVYRSMVEENWDLLIEALLSWEYLGLAETEHTRIAWRALATRQRPDGSLARRENSVSEDASESERFASSYHTTLLAVMSGASSERTQADVSPDTSSNPREPDSSAEQFDSARDLMRDAWRWVVNSHERDQVADRSLLPYWLLGWWIFGHWQSSESRFTPQVGSRLLMQSRELETSELLAPSKATALLSLIAAGIVYGQDKENSSASQTLSTFAALLSSPGRRTVDDRIAFAGKCILLDNMGFSVPTYRMDPARLRAIAKRCAGDPQRRNVELLVSCVNAVTCFGSIEYRARKTDIWIDYLLLSAMDQAVRRYDLAFACDIARSLVYLSTADDGWRREFLNVLVRNQTDAGALGYLGPESQSQTGLLEGPYDQRDVQTMITVSAMWWLTEAFSERRWRLAESLRADNQ